MHKIFEFVLTHQHNDLITMIIMKCKIYIRMMKVDKFGDLNWPFSIFRLGIVNFKVYIEVIGGTTALMVYNDLQLTTA